MIDNIVFNPQETSRLAIQRLEYRRDHKHMAMPFYLDDIDKHLLPLLPGDLVTVIGRPGNGKTAFMLRWARDRAEEIVGYENRVCVYVTYEQYIEDLHSIQLAASTGVNITNMARGDLTEDDMKIIMGAAVKRAQVPLWYVGHSTANRKARPKITPNSLIDSLQKLEEDRDVKIDSVFVDYLQRIPFDNARVESKTIGTMGVLDDLKDFALALDCPFIVGVQARREVDSRKEPIPGMDDGQWTSNIEQASDKIFSVTRPRKYKLDGEMFGSVVVEGHCQMLITLLKQKLGEDGIPIWVYFDPAYNRLDQMQEKTQNFNDVAGWAK